MKKFKKTYIEITNICNLSCDFCPKTSRKPEFMEVELFKDIINKVSGHSKHLYFHVLGEPLMHPNIDVFLDICNENDFVVNITTNATLLYKYGDKIIGKPAFRQINISLHSFEANENNYSIDEYLSEILKFINNPTVKEKHIVSLRLWNLEDNIQNTSNDIIIKWLKENFEIEDVRLNELKEKNSLKINEKLYINQANRFKWPIMSAQDECDRGYCYGLQNQIAILVDGTVVPCCLDGEACINLGNIKENSLEDIINSTRANAIVEGFKNRYVIEELCKKCNYRSRFN